MITLEYPGKVDARILVVDTQFTNGEQERYRSRGFYPMVRSDFGDDGKLYVIWSFFDVRQEPFRIAKVVRAGVTYRKEADIARYQDDGDLEGAIRAFTAMYKN